MESLSSMCFSPRCDSGLRHDIWGPMLPSACGQLRLAKKSTWTFALNYFPTPPSFSDTKLFSWDCSMDKVWMESMKFCSGILKVGTNINFLYFLYQRYGLLCLCASYSFLTAMSQECKNSLQELLPTIVVYFKWKVLTIIALMVSASDIPHKRKKQATEVLGALRMNSSNVQEETLPEMLY